MNKSLMLQVLLALLGDGSPLGETYQASLDILLPEHDKALLKRKFSISGLVHTLQELDGDQKM